MSNIKEYFSGKSGSAFYIICIGKKFQKIFKKTTLPFYLNYCKKYDIGLVVVENFIDQNFKQYPLYRDYPAYQRLLAPSEIKKKYPKYKILCDIDADCIPGFLSRNIFSFSKNIRNNEIYVITPYPVSKTELGKRLSLLRKTYVDSKYPLNSMILASDPEEMKFYGYKYRGTVPTIGTCMGTTKTLAETGKQYYKEILKDKKFKYLQNYRINQYSKKYKIRWLPYEFQAIWNFEMSLHYPFLFNKKYKNFFNDCVMAVLHRVDFLHFAGSWPENNSFFKTTFKNKGSMSKYYKNLGKYIKSKIKVRSYGKINYKKNIN